MKAKIKFEEGRGFHIYLYPETKEENQSCVKIARHFDVYPDGARILLALGYITALKTGTNIEELAMGFGFRDN